jgi:hypothetical protein
MLIYDSFGNIYPQGTRTDKPPPVGGSFKFKTIDANKLQSLIQQHKDVSNIGDGTIQAGRPINSLTGNLQERARAALNDPNATAQEKAAARQILGGP